MQSLLVLLSFSALAFAAPKPLDSYAHVKDGYQGLRLPMEKKNLVALHKRANGVAVNNQWWVTFGVGTPPQDLNFLPDTGAAAFTVQSTLMPQSDRGDAILYDPGKSSTADSDAWPGYTCDDFGFSGPVYNETITAGGQAFADVALCVWNHAPSPAYGDRTGNLGMGPGGTYPTSPEGIPIFMSQIGSRLPQNVATFSFNSYTLQGELDLGFVDTSKYTGELSWRDTLRRDYWFVRVDAMLDSNGNAVGSIDPFNALLDHGGGGLTLTQKGLDWYFGQISGAVFNSDANTYYYPCDADLPDLVFSINGLTISVPKWSWQGGPVDSGSATCKPRIVVGPSDSVYFGTGFLEGVFSAFDYDNWRIGLANRPAYSTTIPGIGIAGSTKFCDGSNFSGNCVQALWLSNTCGKLSGTSYYHNVGSFSPSEGYCTLYSDDGCASPISDFAGIRAPGSSDTGAAKQQAGSYACFYPSDYPIRGNGMMQFCTERGFSGDCEQLQWQSFACQNLDDSIAKNFLSAGPDKGYCYLFTNKDCSGAIEDGAPFVYPGRDDTEFGSQVQSFMCL